MSAEMTKGYSRLLSRDFVLHFYFMLSIVSVEDPQKKILETRLMITTDG